MFLGNENDESDSTHTKLGNESKDEKNQEWKTVVKHKQRKSKEDKPFFTDEFKAEAKARPDVVKAIRNDIREINEMCKRRLSDRTLRKY